MINQQISDSISRAGHKETIESIQILRALAFLGIFSSHLSIPAIGSWGSWGVSVFIVLSGFLMVYRYFDKPINCSFQSAGSFAIHKIGKLYHLHILTLIADLWLPVLFSGAKLMHTLYLERFNIVLNTSLIQSWFPDSKNYFSMNAVAWFLSDCLFFYFAFPFVLKFLRKLTSTVKIIFAMLLIWIIQLLVSYFSYQIDIPATISNNFGKWMTYICPLFRLGDFCMGGMLGLFFIKYKQKTIENKRRRQWLPSVIEIAAILLLFFTLMIHSGEIKIFRWKWFSFPKWLPSSLLMVWAFAANDGVITRSMRSRWLVKIGDLSAYAFLIHQVTIKFVEKSYNYVFGAEIIPIIKVTVSLIVTLCLSYAYFRTRQHRE